MKKSRPSHPDVGLFHIRQNELRGIAQISAGRTPPTTPEAHGQLIEPVGVTTRQSSDVLAIDNPYIAAAIRHIRDHACRGLSAPELLQHVPLSGTVLDRQFRKYLGRSPQAEIRAVRLKRARELLAKTDMGLRHIARLVGFEHPEYLSVVFKRESGETPGEYRRKALAADPSHPI